MPNYVTNIIQFPDKESADKVLAFTKHEYLDYNIETARKIFIGCYEGYNPPDDGDLLEDHFDYIRRPFDFARIIPESYVDIGENWFYWRNENWGTKWNAIKFLRVSDCTIRFVTAWNHPFPVMLFLSMAYFPHIVFDVKFANEDLGSKCGAYTLFDGCASFRFLDRYAETSKSKDFASILLHGVLFDEWYKSLEEI